MRFSDIKERYIYNVNFNEVEKCEFDGIHLALVLKKNNDKETCIVMPFTSQPNGVGKNKFKVGKIDTLPTNLRTKTSYAVYNQIRTLNASRFMNLKENGKNINAKIDDDIFLHLLNLGINDIVYNLNIDEKISFFKSEYEKSCVTKIINLSYDILKINNKDLTEELELKLKMLINNIDLELYKNDIEKKVLDVISKIILNNE